MPLFSAYLTFLAKWFAEDRGFKTVPPKCGCNKFGSWFFLEFSDHEKKSHHVFTDNRLGARTYLTHLLHVSFIAGNVKLRGWHRSRFSSGTGWCSKAPQDRNQGRSQRSLLQSFLLEQRFLHCRSSRNHKFSLPIFTNSKIKTNRLPRLTIDWWTFIVWEFGRFSKFFIYGYFGAECIAYCVNMMYSQFVVESDLSAETLAFNSLRMENNFESLGKCRQRLAERYVCRLI